MKPLAVSLYDLFLVTKDPASRVKAILSHIPVQAVRRQWSNNDPNLNTAPGSIRVAPKLSSVYREDFPFSGLTEAC